MTTKYIPTECPDLVMEQVSLHNMTIETLDDGDVDILLHIENLTGRKGYVIISRKTFMNDKLLEHILSGSFRVHHDHIVWE